MELFLEDTRKSYATKIYLCQMPNEYAFPTCPCRKIYREEAVGVKSYN